MEVISQLEWKDILLVLMGSGVTIFAFLYKIIRDYLKKYKLVTPLLGAWHTYQFSRARFHPIFRKEKWDIHRSLSGITIITSDEERSFLRYKGRVSFDSGHAIIYIQGIEHPESIQYRLVQPIPNEDTMMLGFFVGKDFDHELFSAIKLVCKNERTDDEAKEILSSSIEWTEEECCIRLSKQPIKANQSHEANHQ